MSKAPQQVHTQTRDPRRSVQNRDPGRHYVLVSDEQVAEYLDLASSAGEDEDKYRIESRERKDTGRNGLVLLSCSMDDHIQDMASNSLRARGEEVRSEDSRAEGDAINVTSKTVTPRSAVLPV